MHAVRNFRHPYSPPTTTHFNVNNKEEGGSSGGSDSASIDVVVVRGGDEEHDEEEHYYFAPQINTQNGGAHVESNPSYMMPGNDQKQQGHQQEDENPYFNPNYISRASSAADSQQQINEHHQHYPTPNGTPIDHLPAPPHYYEVHPQNSSSHNGVNLIPLALVDREVHSRRVSALILPSPPDNTAKFTRFNHQLYHQQPTRTGRRRFSVTTQAANTVRKMVNDDIYAQSTTQLFSLPPAPVQQKETLGRRAAQKFLQQKGAFRRAKPGGSKLAALGSELSQSASALYSLFTTTNGSGGNATRNGDTDDEEEFDQRSVLSIDHLQHQYLQQQSHYQQPVLVSSHQAENNKPEQIYAAASVQMSAKACVSLATQSLMDLTDKTEDVSEHTQRGIEFLERYGQFAKERALIEDEYAIKIRGLVKKYSGKKKDSDEWRAFSYVSAFQMILREIESLAAQHEIISDKLKKEICPTITQKCQAFRSGRKEQLQSLHSLNNGYQAKIDDMQRSLKSYMKAFKDAENAHVKFYKADNNMDLSRAEVEKCRQNLEHKNNLCERARQTYAAVLQETNNAQREHYNQKVPHLLEEMRQLDVNRIQETKQAMMQCVDVETSVLSVVQRCYNDMREAIRTIDPPKDTRVVVEQNKTGYAIPLDFEFKDLGSPAKILEGNGESSIDGSINSTATLKRGQFAAVTNGKQIARKSSMHQRIFGGPSNSNGKSNGISDYGNLPPQQRCRKIEARLQEIVKDIQTREQSKAGLAKMFEVYTNDPKMGNAADVAQQMKQFDKEIATKRQEMDHYNQLLTDTQKELNVPFSPINLLPNPPMNGTINGHTSPRMQNISSNLINVNNRVSYSEDSVSSDGSTVMGVSRQLNGHATSNAHIPHIDSSAETVSNSNGSHRNANTSSSTSAAGGDLYEDPEENLPPLGTCKALYAFEGAASGDSTTISMSAGEELHLLERDDGQGDGWTRVRNPRTGNEGFVPSAYIECHWF